MDIPYDEIRRHLSKPVFKLVSQVADEMHVECFVIGGYVRDIFLHRLSKDIDFLVIGSGIALAETVATTMGKQSKLTVYKNFGTAQVKYKGYELEFVGARKESYTPNSRKPVIEDGTLEDDLKRRDFTINTLAIYLNGLRFGELVDYFNGMQDLKNHIIRTPLNPHITFSDDPLRMMRAIRFAAQLGFDIHPKTFDAIVANRGRIAIVSAERITDELNKIMLSPRPSTGFVLLEKTGLLDIVFPELAALKGVENRDGIQHKDNFYHTLAVLDNISQKTDNLWLRWAALLHDIGKPVTKRWDPQVGWTFYNHNHVGAKMIPRIFQRMRLPLNEKMKYVQQLVALHMRPMQLVDEQVTDSAVRRLLFDSGDDIDDLMMLCEADVTTKNPAKACLYIQNFKTVRRKLNEIEEKDRIRNFQPPVDGNEIMQTFGLPPSREVGLLKSAIKEAILDGEIPNDHDAAYRFILEKAKEMGLKPIR